MNYLDSIKIINAYSYAFAQGGRESTGLYRSLSIVPSEIINPETLELDKDMVVSAACIRFAHTVLFNSLTPQEYDSIRMLLTSIDSFVDEKTYTDIVECNHLSKRKFFVDKKAVELAQRQMQVYLSDSIQASLNPYRSDEIDFFMDSVSQRREQLVFELNAKQITIDQLIDAYCEYFYTLLGLNYGNKELICFYPISALKTFIQEGKYTEFLEPYRCLITELSI